MSGAKSQIAKVPAPSMGLDADSAPAYVSQQHGIEITNFIPGKAGRLVWSAGIAAVTTGTATATSYRGAWVYDENVMTISNGTKLRFEGGASAIESASATLKGTLPSFARVRDKVYGVAERDVSPGGAHVIATLDAFGATTLQVNYPGYPQAVAAHNDRLFMLGYLASATAYALFWSDVGGPAADTAAQWQDDVTGLTNQIVLDDGTADYGVALARVGRALLVLRRNSAYLLTGDTPSSFSIQRVSNYGCVDQGTVLEYGGGVFFQSDEGVVFFNGSSFTLVSRAVNAAIPLRTAPGGTATTGSACRLNEEYVLFNFSDGLGAYFPLIFHVPSGAWSTVIAPAGTTYGWVGRSTSKPFMLTQLRERLDAAPLVRLPLAGTGAVRGTGAITTAVVPLGTPANKAKLKRLMVDYVSTKRLLVSPDPNLTVRGLDELGTEVIPATVLPGDLSGVRKRAVLDCFSEVESLQLQFTVSVGNVVEVHDAWVEYDAAQPRTG